MLFLDTITFHNAKHRISTEMGCPKICLIYRAGRLMAVSDDELRWGLVFEVCFRTVTLFAHQLPHWAAVDHVSSLLGSSSRMLAGVLQGSCADLSSRSGDCLFGGDTQFYWSEGESSGAFQAAGSRWGCQGLMPSWTWDLRSPGTSCAWGNSLPKRIFGISN